MSGYDATIPSSEGGTFQCFIALPSDDKPTSAVVLVCSIDGVDGDLRDIADAFAAKGYVAVAPDMFWRTVPGPLPSGDPRTRSRSQPRMERLAENERDVVDALAFLKTLPQWNGNAAIMGFCYGGPFAIIGPRRLGFQAGLACHGSQMLPFIGELDGVIEPIRLIWGDRDHVAPEPVLSAFQAAANDMPNLEVRVFPGVEHGFMMPGSSAFDREARDFAMQRAFAVLDSLSNS